MARDVLSGEPIGQDSPGSTLNTARATDRLMEAKRLVYVTDATHHLSLQLMLWPSTNGPTGRWLDVYV